MKTILYFFGLKIAEIGGVSLAIYLLVLAGPYTTRFFDKYGDILGLYIVVPMFIFLMGWFFFEFIRANWKKAKELSGRE